jgi:hypothetical protein
MGLDLHPMSSILPFSTNQPPKSPQTATVNQLIEKQNTIRRDGSNVSILVGTNGELVSQNFKA